MNLIIQQLLKSTDLSTLESMVQNSSHQREIYTYIGRRFLEDAKNGKITDAAVIQSLKESIAYYDAETGNLDINHLRMQQATTSRPPLPEPFETYNSRPRPQSRQAAAPDAARRPQQTTYSSDPCSSGSRVTRSSC